MTYETVIGLEVHAELSTKSKIFCGCSAEFGGEPNTRVCPVCAGMPGSLPRLNRAVVEYAVKLGVALNCKITQNCKFDRKNYFYPDLPKAYQVSQLYAPICRDGHADIGGRIIGIREIHMEEDAGKLLHDPKTGSTFMDFNRCGVPLLEIVTQPDFRAADEVLAYLEHLRETLLYLGISDCKMQEGSMRCDITLSVRKLAWRMGVRTEMKNLNSFRAIKRAIEYESARQIKILEGNGQITQETRRWDDDAGESYGMRSKENAQDYRYFPEPDLLPIHIDDGWLKQITDTLPELARQKRERYIRDYGIAENAVKVITAHRNIALLFEEITRLCGDAGESANLITGEIMRLVNNADTDPEDITLGAGKLAELIKLVQAGKISRAAYKETVEAVFTDNVDINKYIAEHGLLMIKDDTKTAAAVYEAISENPAAVSDYRNGKDKAFGFLMGQVMRKLGKGGDPEQIKNALVSALE